MKSLHRAAAIRAYRTLAQGLGSSAVITALVAVIAALASDADTVRTALLAAGVAVGTTVASAIGSFWQGVAKGLPEAGDDVAETQTRPASGSDLVEIKCECGLTTYLTRDSLGLSHTCVACGRPLEAPGPAL